MLLLAPTPLLHAQLPSLGDGADMTASAERRLGDRIAKEIFRDPDYEDDPLLLEYVDGIWRSLMAAARTRGELSPELDDRFAWEIVLNRERTINAFALPGGYMGVNLGLIGLVASRDELASVLGHELSHITQRHISRLIAKQGETTPWLIAAMVLGVLAARKSPDAANASIVGGQALAMQNQLNFSRDMEREADRVGFGVMTGAGYEPQGFASMFEKLQAANRINDNGSFPYLRSHPLTSERIADVQARVQLQPQAVKRTTPDYVHGMMSARARALSAPGVDILRAWVREAQTLPAGNLGVPPPVSAASAAAAAPAGNNRAVGAAIASQEAAARRIGVLYAGAMASVQLRDVNLAKTFIARLNTAVAGDADAVRVANLLAAELALREHNPTQAIALIGAGGGGPVGPVDPAFAAARSAGNSGRPELLMLAQARLAAGAQPGMAEQAQRLQNWTISHPRDAQAWNALSLLQGALNQPAQAARSAGESRAAQLDFSGALDRFKAAQDMARRSSGKGNDYIEASIIDQRTREMADKVKQSAREQALER